VGISLPHVPQPVIQGTHYNFSNPSQNDSDSYAHQDRAHSNQSTNQQNPQESGHVFDNQNWHYQPLNYEIPLQHGHFPNVLHDYNPATHLARFGSTPYSLTGEADFYPHQLEPDQTAAVSQHEIGSTVEQIRNGPLDFTKEAGNNPHYPGTEFTATTLQFEAATNLGPFPSESNSQNGRSVQNITGGFPDVSNSQVGRGDEINIGQIPTEQNSQNGRSVENITGQFPDDSSSQIGRGDEINIGQIPNEQNSQIGRSVENITGRFPDESSSQIGRGDENNLGQIPNKPNGYTNETNYVSPDWARQWATIEQLPDVDSTTFEYEHVPASKEFPESFEHNLQFPYNDSGIISKQNTLSKSSRFDLAPFQSSGYGLYPSSAFLHSDTILTTLSSEPSHSSQYSGSPPTISDNDHNHMDGSEQAPENKIAIKPPKFWNCPHKCGVSARSEMALKSHMLKKHQKHRCDCGSTFRHEKDLKRHKAQSPKHSGKLFYSPCGEKYTRQDSMTRHVKKCKDPRCVAQQTQEE
jgi:hypothetical protein